MEHVITWREILDSVRKGGKTAGTERWIREQEIKQGKYIEGTRYTWYKSLHYSDQVWAVLRDRVWSLKQARR